MSDLTWFDYLMGSAVPFAFLCVGLVFVLFIFDDRYQRRENQRVIDELDKDSDV